MTQLLVLVEGIPPIAGRVGHPRFRPDRVQGDRGYDAALYRHALRARGITPVLAKRGMPPGSGLGQTRWVVERGLSGGINSDASVCAGNDAPTFTKRS